MALREILQKQHKTLEDAEFILAKIRSFRFFESFFTQNCRNMDSAGLMALCKGFGYEKNPVGSFIFQKGDASNNKYYVILSGKIAVVLPKRGMISQPKSNSVEPMKPVLRKELSSRTIKVDKVSFNQRLSRIVSNEGGLKLPIPAEETKDVKDASPMKKKGKIEFRTQKTIWGPASLMYTKEDVYDDLLVNCTGKIEDSGVDNTKINDTVVGNNELVDQNELYDTVKFEEYGKKFGTIVRYMEAGESFGELALKNNTPRSATVICAADCEFLIITKQQFELIFLTKDREKEEFLRATFPFLKTLSPIFFNYILYSFQTEMYTKGNFLVKEGTVTNKDSRFFLIHQGECVIEKHLVLEVENPYDRTKPISESTQPIQVAVIVSGMIAGEEIITDAEHYTYTVKALSESVMVHAVRKSEFETRFVADFQEFLLSMYLKKKKQRDELLENVRKEYEQKSGEIKAKNIYGVQNLRIKEIMKKPALQSMSKYMHRENKTADSKDLLGHLISPKMNKDRAESSYLFTRIAPDEESFHVESNQGAQSATLKSKKIKIKNIDREPGKHNVESRIEYLNKLPDLPRSQENPMEPKDLDSMKFFAPENPRKLKHTRSFSNKSVVKASEGNHDYPSSPGLTHTNSIFKDFVKNKKLAIAANEIGDSIQARSLTASPNSLKVSNSDRIKQIPSPLIGVSTVNFHTVQRVSTASFKRPQTQYPLTAGLEKEKEKEMDYIPLSDKVYSNSGPNSPVSTGRLRTGVDVDKTMRPSHFKDNRKDMQQFFVTSPQGKEEDFDFEGLEQKTTEEGKFVKLANINVGGMFSGPKSNNKSSHGSRLHSSQAWRKKVFTKTHQRMGSADLPAVKLAMVSTPITTINNRK